MIHASFPLPQTSLAYLLTLLCILVLFCIIQIETAVQKLKGSKVGVSLIAYDSSAEPGSAISIMGTALMLEALELTPSGGGKAFGQQLVAGIETNCASVLAMWQHKALVEQMRAQGPAKKKQKTDVTQPQVIFIMHSVYGLSCLICCLFFLFFFFLLQTSHLSDECLCKMLLNVEIAAGLSETFLDNEVITVLHCFCMPLCQTIPKSVLHF